MLNFKSHAEPRPAGLDECHCTDLERRSANGELVLAYRRSREIDAGNPTLPERARIIAGCAEAISRAWEVGQSKDRSAEAIGSYAELGSLLVQSLNGHPLPPSSSCGVNLEAVAGKLNELAKVIAGKSIDIKITPYLRECWHRSAVEVNKFADHLRDKAAANILSETSL